MEPLYLTEARKHIGLKELTGTNDHPLLLSWWIRLNVKYLYKQAWCGLFVAHCMQVTGNPIPKNWYRAKAWLEWGEKSDAPKLGCIVVFSRTGGGHVGFVVGKDNSGRLLVLGGNQGNQVSIAPFDMSRVEGYRVPKDFALSSTLPIITSQAASSDNEA